METQNAKGITTAIIALFAYALLVTGLYLNLALRCETATRTEHWMIQMLHDSGWSNEQISDYLKHRQNLERLFDPKRNKRDGK